MKFKDSTIRNVLKEGNYATEEDLAKADKYAKDHGTSIVEFFLSGDLISRDVLGQAIAESFGLPFANLRSNKPNESLVTQIPEDIARKYHVIFFDKGKDGLYVATDDPTQDGLYKALESVFKDQKIKLHLALEEDIESLLIYYRKGIETNFSKIIKGKGRIAPEIVDQIFEDALLIKASDVHFEPQEKDAVVRFRVDGVLQEAGHIPREYYDNIVNRIKVQSKLRIDEHFAPQDGALRMARKDGSGTIDLRISIIPTLNGEKVSVRILASYVRDLTLKDIGLPLGLEKQIIRSAGKPYGMILVTGPTGSGKTTTLYSLIKQLNTRQINITTIEDPVEYKIEGINQIQANSQAKLTFAQGLRSIARQDPDIIFVGEIRDMETADIAVNAALTGHLLLSTFHANNAATAIPRFIEMGIEPFLVGSTIELIIAQRLVRKTCDACKYSFKLTNDDIKRLPVELSEYLDLKNQTFYKGKGCPVCNNTGFHGRVGVFEYITASPELQDLIAKQPSTKEVAELARQQGMPRMFEDGIEKVKLGITTIDELLRVVSPEK